MTALLSKVASKTRLIAFYGLTAVVITGLLSTVILRRAELSSPRVTQGDVPSNVIQASSQVADDCVEVENRVYVCADRDTLARWREYENQERNLGQEGIKRKQYKTILKDVCREQNLEAPCEDYLLGMATVESGLGKWMVGDNSKSHGWYHIQTKLHNVSMKCANDLRCSSEWTVKNLIKNGYKTNPTWALGAHNSRTKKWNEKYVAAVNSKMR